MIEHMKKNKILLFAFITLISLGCSKEAKDTNGGSSNSADKILLIENGSQSIAPNESIEYKAVLVDKEGNTSVPKGVVWTSSNTNICTIVPSGVISVKSTGTVTINAKVSEGGQEYTATVPLGIQAPSVFAVAPSAIIWNENDNIQLESIYFSTNPTKPSYTYSSDNSAVATVSASGLVSTKSAGSCILTVTANNLDGSPSVLVPVLVVGTPKVVLPIVNIKVSPPSKDLFKNETQQLNAEAFDVDGNNVTAAFTWKSMNENIVMVSANGLVTPVRSGRTYVQASTKGIIGQAEIIVNPDTMIIVDPFYTSIPQNGSFQFKAETYLLTRTNMTPLNISQYKWIVPTYGLSVFDIGTVDDNGLVSIKSNGMPGMTGTLLAQDLNDESLMGAASFVVGLPSDCDCGMGNSDVASIEVSNSTPINTSLFGGSVQLNVVAKDKDGNVVNDPQLVFCSGNELVATVDSDGEIFVSGIGSAKITICSGSYAKTEIDLNVTL